MRKRVIAIDKLGKVGLVCLALVLALGSLGLAYSTWTDTAIIPATVYAAHLNDSFTWVVSNDDGAGDSVYPYGTIDPGDDGGGSNYDMWGALSSNDPSEPQAMGWPCARYDKDVARTTAVLIARDLIEVSVGNAYPSYYPTVFFGFRNEGTVSTFVQTVEIDEDATTPDPVLIDELTVTVTGIYEGQGLDPGDEVVGAVHVHLEQCAEQNATYIIRIRIVVVVYTLGGTPGFWGNWDAHNTYPQEEVEAWLALIDNDSSWLGPTTAAGMEALIEAGRGAGAAMYDRFLAHYMATRLDVEAGRLSLLTHHDVSGLDPGNYLDLATPSSATIPEIIAGVESKYSTPVTGDEYEIMKDVCDDLNNLEI